MTAPTLFTSPFTVHRIAILSSPALRRLVLNLLDPLQHSIDPVLVDAMTDVQRAVAAELVASHAKHGEADPGFVLLATAEASAIAKVEAEDGPMDWAALAG